MCPLPWDREAGARSACAAPERQRRTPAEIVAMSVFMLPPARSEGEPAVFARRHRGRMTTAPARAKERDHDDDTGPRIRDKEAAVGGHEPGCDAPVILRT